MNSAHTPAPAPALADRNPQDEPDAQVEAWQRWRPWRNKGEAIFFAFPRGVLLGDLLNKAFLTYNYDNYDNYMITMT